MFEQAQMHDKEPPKNQRKSFPKIGMIVWSEMLAAAQGVYVSCVYQKKQKTRRIELLNVVGFYIVSRSDWIKQNGPIWTSPKHLATPRQSGPIWILPNSVLRHLAGPGPQTIALIEAWLVTRNATVDQNCKAHWTTDVAEFLVVNHHESSGSISIWVQNAVGYSLMNVMKKTQSAEGTNQWGFPKLVDATTIDLPSSVTHICMWICNAWYICICRHKDRTQLERGNTSKELFGTVSNGNEYDIWNMPMWIWYRYISVYIYICVCIYIYIVCVYI